MCGDRGYSDERAPVRAGDRNTRGRSRRKIYDDGRAARTARRERRKKTKPTRKTQPSSSEECRHIHTAVQRQRARTEQRVSEINRPHRGAKRSADRAEKIRNKYNVKRHSSNRRMPFCCQKRRASVFVAHRQRVSQAAGSPEADLWHTPRAA